MQKYIDYNISNIDIEPRNKGSTKLIARDWKFAQSRYGCAALSASADRSALVSLNHPTPMYLLMSDAGANYQTGRQHQLPQYVKSAPAASTTIY